MKKFMTAIMFGLLLSVSHAQFSDYPQIRNQTCDALTTCDQGLSCYRFPGIGLRCAESNPCSWFECPEGTQCHVAESYPMQVICSRPCEGDECVGQEDTVIYDLTTQTEIIIQKSPDEQTTSNISVWTTPGNRGILETSTASADCYSKLSIENQTLYMETSVGNKQINVMPEDAISISETPESISKVELKEESEEPVYSVKGVKQARLLFFIPVSMSIETKINAGTGEVTAVHKPWWSFLAW